MRNLSSIEIKVENPCSENWENMTAMDRGRFCDKCQKEVIDFTTWSDAALYQFFSNRKGRICGRFLDTQLNKPINIPYQPHSKLYRLTIALGLTLICTQVPTAIAQNRPPKKQSAVITVNAEKAKAKDTLYGILHGKITGERNKPLGGITIMLFDDGKFIEASFTSSSGDFVFRSIEPGYYNLLVLDSGYEALEIKDILLTPGETKIQNVFLKEEDNKNRIMVSGEAW